MAKKTAAEKAVEAKRKNFHDFGEHRDKGMKQETRNLDRVVRENQKNRKDGKKSS